MDALLYYRNGMTVVSGIELVYTHDYNIYLYKYIAHFAFSMYNT